MIKLTLREYLDKNDNNPILSYNTNKKEMIGLETQGTIDKLKQIRDNIVGMISHNNSKERQR